MIHAHGVEAVRRAEAAAMADLPDGALMQRAASALAFAVTDELRSARGRRPVYGARVVLLVGAGSNGGDALWAGARLAGRGAQVVAVVVAPSAHAEGLAGLRGAGGRAAPAAAGADELRTADLVVDGLLGIGGRPGLDPAVGELLAAVPDGVPVVAVDLPSGVDPGTGAVGDVVVTATRTVTFGTAKPALLLPPAAALVGRLDVVDIGLDPAALGSPEVTRLEPADVAARWPHPSSGDDKYRRGVVGVVAGGPTYTGAAVLAVGSAVRTGAGMVRYVGPQEPTDLVRARWPEVVPGEGRVQAWVVGPGLDPDGDDGQRGHAETALASDLPCVVDAGALELVTRRGAPTLLTPHAGELARLLTRLQDDGPEVSRDDVEARPLQHARRAAELTGATVLLKGAVTLVVPPDGGTVMSEAEGPAWLASAGSGDVLAGVAGTLLAAGLDPRSAGAVAASVHGLAGRRASGGGPLDAGRLLDALPGTVADLLALAD
ncbi:bifunctional ADP-dependent NAD(P)H-hydrate dehydratase/NAD(P)H-hydrate epimerase [Angustibacter peucedani]